MVYFVASDDMVMYVVITSATKNMKANLTTKDKAAK